MRKYSVLLLLFAGLTIVSAQSLETVIKKNSEALGLSARRTMPHLKTTGHLIMKDTEARIPFRIVQSKPDMVRIETTVFGFKAIQTYDGKTAWLLSPTQGMEAKQTDAREIEFIAAATAIDGPFSVNKNNKYTLKYGGSDKYLDQDVEVLIWHSDNERLKYYILADNYQISGIRYEYQKNGGWYSMEYRIKSYQDFEGSIFPREIAAVYNGVEMVSLFITKIEKIAEADLKLFGKPSYEM